ncbi:unnamed protein product [Phytophthora fragariaefolia]|uniref:Unnamed protein product n=1 Tax=Phytophthora fragariaefolia TaxID=1490495 RepID=A0A9W6XXN8_9STRA|nr:unnamed protein product [Phytophthora fragariaefolia]
MKKIDESEFLYEEEEEERVESEEEEAALARAEKHRAEKDVEEKKDGPVRPSTFLQSSGSEESFEVVENTAAVAAGVRPLEIEDYDLLDGTPPVSPRSADKLAYTCRQSSTLIKDAIALARQAQRQRVEQRIASIASKRGDGYAGH